jgi:cell surface protein SprA
VGAEAGNRNLGFIRDVETELPLPSSAFDIASVQLQESFSPLIGLNIAMKNSVSLKAEYRQQRNLALNITSVQLMEGNTKELVVGVGYTIKNFDVIIKAKNDHQNKVRNDLKLTLDFSYKNVKSLLRKIEEDITQASSGNKVFSVKFSADYTLSSKVNLQFFYEHQGTTPLLSTSFPVKSDNVGINVKLMLTR